MSARPNPELDPDLQAVFFEPAPLRDTPMQAHVFGAVLLTWFFGLPLLLSVTGIAVAAFFVGIYPISVHMRASRAYGRAKRAPLEILDGAILVGNRKFYAHEVKGAAIFRRTGGRYALAFTPTEHAAAHWLFFQDETTARAALSAIRPTAPGAGWLSFPVQNDASRGGRALLLALGIVAPIIIVLAEIQAHDHRGADFVLFAMLLACVVGAFSLPLLWLYFRAIQHGVTATHLEVDGQSVVFETRTLHYRETLPEARATGDRLAIQPNDMPPVSLRPLPIGDAMSDEELSAFIAQLISDAVNATPGANPATGVYR
jgi:hypothetical protein